MVVAQEARDSIKSKPLGARAFPMRIYVQVSDAVRGGAHIWAYQWSSEQNPEFPRDLNREQREVSHLIRASTR